VKLYFLVVNRYIKCHIYFSFLIGLFYNEFLVIGFFQFLVKLEEHQQKKLKPIQKEIEKLDSSLKIFYKFQRLLKSGKKVSSWFYSPKRLRNYSNEKLRFQGILAQKETENDDEKKFFDENWRTCYQNNWFNLEQFNTVYKIYQEKENARRRALVRNMR